MNTEDLIQSLGQDVRPVSRRAATGRIAFGIAVGGVVTLGVIAALLGVRPDLGLAMRGYSFWLKSAYTLSLAIGAIALVVRLARPDTVKVPGLRLIAIPFLVLAAVGAAEMAHVPPAEWLAMWLGKSWKACPWLVLLLSLPIFLGLLWSFRRLAPTRLRAAGAAAGLASGSCAAMLYCLHCPEVSAIFVLTWYTMGIAFAAGLGALLGPRLLRW